jgi:signal peptidase II
LNRSVKLTAIVFLVLFIDQAVKVWVKTHMAYGEEMSLFGLGLSWARVHFVENNGMAFGLSLGGDYGKLALSLFRILAVVFLVYYIRILLKSKASFGLLLSFALILAGAVGNIIDSAFYGMIFSESYHGAVATMFPEEGGYGAFLHGKVVDMLYFPIAKGYFPDWMPIWGGDPYLFFKPVFNIADMSITIGVVNILLFQRQFFSQPIQETATEDPTTIPSTSTDDSDEEDSDASSDTTDQSGEQIVSTKDE